MATQLRFQPSATQIGVDTWIVVPKNNSDEIVINEATVSGTYKVAMKCNTLAKDIILALWGTPALNEDDELCANQTKTQIVAALCTAYANIWTADETTGKFIVEGATAAEDVEYDTLSDAMKSQVNAVLGMLQISAPASSDPENESEGEGEGGDQSA